MLIDNNFDSVSSLQTDIQLKPFNLCQYKIILIQLALFKSSPRWSPPRSSTVLGTDSIFLERCAVTKAALPKRWLSLTKHPVFLTTNCNGTVLEKCLSYEKIGDLERE